MAEKKTALVAVESNVARDPRVRRQIDWLTEESWVVDSLGFGERPAQAVRDHFTIKATPSWMHTKLGTLVIYGFLSQRRKFETLTLTRFPLEVRERVRRGDYDLIILNDRHFAPWVSIPKDFTPAARGRHIHLDLHEYFVPTYPRNNLWRLATAGYYEWSRRLFGNPAFTTRSTVNSGIAKLYAEEFGFAEPAVIRNSPAFVDQQPQPVDPTQIKLIHHGTARWDRGLKEMVDALRLMDSRFTITFMLVGSSEFLAELAEYAADLGARVQIVPPAPMTTLAAEVNQYDLEVMFYAPHTRNLELALPNKLFEAVQGRLGLVVGTSPMMVDVIREYANGVVVEGWDPADLAATLNALQADDVTRLKAASHRAAQELSAESERHVFLSTVGVSEDRSE